MKYSAARCTNSLTKNRLDDAWHSPPDLLRALAAGTLPARFAALRSTSPQYLRWTAVAARHFPPSYGRAVSLAGTYLGQRYGYRKNSRGVSDWGRSVRSVR
jgi:hypothetical protein